MAWPVSLASPRRLYASANGRRRAQTHRAAAVPLGEHVLGNVKTGLSGAYHAFASASTPRPRAHLSLNRPSTAESAENRPFRIAPPAEGPVVAKITACLRLAAAATITTIVAACTPASVTESPRSMQMPLPAELIMARGPMAGGMRGPWWAQGTGAGPPGARWGRMRHGMMQRRGTPLLAPAPQTPAAQSEGERVFARYCTQCHRLPDPRRHRPDEWPAVVERMRNHMRASGPQVASPSPSDLRAILGYLSRGGAG